MLGPLASITRKNDPGSRSASQSVSYDYSAVDEARAAAAKAKATEGEAAKAAYAGDVASAMDAGNRIRALRNQSDAAARQGVRVASTSSSANSSGTGGAESREYHSPKEASVMTQIGTLKPKG